MTAIQAYVLDDVAVLVTDSLSTSSTGRVFDGAKTITVPHMRLAIANNGMAALSPSVARAVQIGATDFDSARAFLAREIRQLARLQYSDPGERAAWTAEWTLFVAGWSASKNAPAAFCISNHGKVGAAPWKVIDIEYMAAVPFVPHAVEAARLDPMGKAMDLLDAQARLDPRNIGGFGTMTMIGEADIAQTVIGRLTRSVRVPEAV